jgi:outer membrane murein-binding lipoprotein Lpp
MTSSDTRLVDFARGRVNRIADAIDNLAQQVKMTNTHIERLNREVGGLCDDVGGLRVEVGSLRSEMNARFDRVGHQVRDVHGEVILQANRIINAQQDATRAMMRLDDIEQRSDEPRV